MKGRLDKVLATCALISRTEAQAALKAGRVTVDGIPVRDGKVKADSDLQTILLDGKRVEGDGFVYLMLYKPVGVLSATEDKKGAVTAMDLLPEEYRKAAVDAVRQLSKDVGIPQDLKAIVKDEDILFLSESAMADACRPGNPMDPTLEDIIALYRSLM